jgi:hypothetical protein
MKLRLLHRSDVSVDWKTGLCTRKGESSTQNYSLLRYLQRLVSWTGTSNTRESAASSEILVPMINTTQCYVTEDSNMRTAKLTE